MGGFGEVIKAHDAASRPLSRHTGGGEALTGKCAVIASVLS